MSEARPDDSMVEISDIDDEPTSPFEPAPKVIIEYRDRGIPWMLVPPLLALSAVIAAVVVYNVVAKWDRQRPSVALVQPEQPINLPDEPKPEPIPIDNALSPPNHLDPTPKTTETPSAVPDPVKVDRPGSELSATMPEVPVVPTVRDPAPVGFDPASIANPPVPFDLGSPFAPVDRDLAAVAQRAGVEPNPAAQPEEVDPDLLPPDPRKARFDRQRRAVEARRKAEAERFLFHAELTAITKQLGRKAAPAIHQLAQVYAQEVPAASLDQAKKALGKTGMYAGADTSERINLLRKLGFPEVSILGDIFDIQCRHQSTAARNAPTKDELYVRSALILVNHPPNRPPTVARPVSGAGIGARANLGVVAPPASASTDSNR